MYFENREQAGQILSQTLLHKYRYEDCAVIALNSGGVIVGEQIAEYIHCVLNMLVIETLDIPGEGLSFGGISQGGRFTYNQDLSAGEISNYTVEYNGYLQEKQREAFQKINRLVGDGGTVDLDLLRDRVIILVSDGFTDRSSIDVAIDFLKPVRYKKLVVATPVASVAAVDRLHITADEMHILDVKANYLDTNHYYEDNKIPSHEEAVKKINDIILNWR